MRIVGGKYKSRVLAEVKSDNIRPTADKVRESLFNILQNVVYGAEFLDLFCGTGAMGIEALSRGASRAVFNDADKNSIKLLKKNLDKLGVSESYQIYNTDAISFLSRGDKFDIIYIDPPYKSDLGLRSLRATLNALKEGGVVIFEDEKPFDEQIDGLNVTDRRKYGRVHLTFFKKGE